ncbi:MAG: NTP transferase domain-containing protein [bacterium]|nr:NTP transferase domain-containing protein [bacterium]
MIKAIIMAGGEGTRLRPLTCNRPKPMIPVINKPVIEHAVSLLKRHGITEIIISLYYLPEVIQNYFGDGSEWGVNISYSVEETPLGTAGGVKQAIGKNDDTFIVLSGDGIIDFDITKILAFHKQKESKFTIILTRVNEPTEYGIVITDQEGKIEKFLEKPSWSEVFTDTANTGMYVIEPDVVNNYIPEREKFDFSLDLFPLLQKNNIPLYGYIADGYWCDVGNLNSYRDVQTDILDDLVTVDMPGIKMEKDIWIGKDVDIHPEAVLKGPIVLGDFVRVKKGAEISEFSVIGDNCIIEENASLRRSVILHSTIIGPKSELRGTVIGKRCVLQEGVSMNEGSVVSDDCRIGTGVVVSSAIRVWPDKSIEQGTMLTSDLIWGQTGKKMLFSSKGITGSFNINITPEFASKIGSAIGAFLGKDKKITISRDTTSAARLIKRAMTAGLLSMGIDVYDMEIESVPVTRYSTRFTNADMGIYIQISPLTGLQFIQIRLFNKSGFQISLQEEKKIENIFFRGDYPRKDAFEIGKLIYPTHHLESYISNINNYLDAAVIKKKKWSIIVDCFNGTAAHIFPELLDYFGCDVTVLRGQIKEFSNELDTKIASRKSLTSLVRMAKINRNIGAIIGPHGTQLTIIDEMGNILTNNDVRIILCLYYLKYTETQTINIPVTASKVLENLITSLGGTVVRTSTKIRAPEDAIDVFIEGPSGRYPFLEQTYDPIITFLLILMFLSREEKTLYEVKENLPHSNMLNTSINCSTEEKAAIMRMLTTNAEQDKIELIDGIKITENDAWILILPDSSEPLIQLYAEGDTVEARDRIIDTYTINIKKYKSKL